MPFARLPDRYIFRYTLSEGKRAKRAIRREPNDSNPMINANLRYNQALAVFAVHGNRWQGVLALTYWAVASGRCTEDVLDAVHGLGIHDRNGDIRRGMESASNARCSFSPTSV